MELTGNCLKEFNKWLENDYEPDEKPIEDSNDAYASESFDILPDSMKYGVYVDWFRSKEVMILIDLSYYDSIVKIYDYKNNEKCHEIDLVGLDIDEYITMAIEKANDLFNERKTAR